MLHSNITVNRLIDNRLVLDKDISLLTMAKTINSKTSVKASAAKPPPGDKTCGLEPAIQLYAIKDGDETKME